MTITCDSYIGGSHFSFIQHIRVSVRAGQFTGDIYNTLFSIIDERTVGISDITGGESTLVIQLIVIIQLHIVFYF